MLQYTGIASIIVLLEIMIMYRMCGESGSGHRNRANKCINRTAATITDGRCCTVDPMTEMEEKII